MWRPKGWKTHIERLAEANGIATRVQCIIMPLDDYSAEAYEAGADAMLEALKKDAWRCIPKDQSYEYTKWNYAKSAMGADKNTHIAIYPDPKGWLVFIPEGDDDEV